MEKLLRPMTEQDISCLAKIYIDYYNNCEGSAWTQTTACKCIHQIWSMEDSFCFVAEKDKIIGFAMGYLKQYDDLLAFNLEEILIDRNLQHQGLGTQCMQELQTLAKQRGVSLIQLQAVNDQLHENFYGKLGFKGANNFVLKSKML